MHRLFKHSLQIRRPVPASPSFPKPRPFSTTRFPDSGTLACPVKTRSVILFRGPDTIKFLQGLVTNDVRRLGEPHCSTPGQAMPNLPAVVAPPVYAAILTPQGRFLFDMFLYRPIQPDEKLDRTGSGPGSGHSELELLADVDGASLDQLLETLKKYRLRSKVEIESVAEEFSCWQRFGPEISQESSPTEEPEADSIGTGGGIDQSGATSSQGNEGGWKWYQDPRCDSLGLRGIFPSQETPPLVEADKEADERHYLLWRLEKGVAEGPSEIPKGEAMPLEYNLAGLNAISFDKGCYIGQELIARTHHRGVIRKRLLPLQFLDDSGKAVENKVAPKTEVIAQTSGKKVGTITTALGCNGLGLLRLEEALKDQGSLVIQGQENVKVKAHRPNWWPTEWFADY